MKYPTVKSIPDKWPVYNRFLMDMWGLNFKILIMFVQKIKYYFTEINSVKLIPEDLI